MVLFFEDLKISKSMRNIINQRKFKVTFNTAFRDVILNCKKFLEKINKVLGLQITWQKPIANYMNQASQKSVEVWQNDELEVCMALIQGHVSCGESMFSKVSNASKLAFIALAKTIELKLQLSFVRLPSLQRLSKFRLCRN